MTRSASDVFLNSADLGIKWKFFDRDRYRLALSMDSRFALRRAEFGSLPGHFFNFEIDGDFAVTRRFSIVGNLQLLTSDSDEVPLLLLRQLCLQLLHRLRQRLKLPLHQCPLRAVRVGASA